MAYATGLGEMLPCHLDSHRLEGIQAHPLVRFEVLNAEGKLAVQHGLMGSWA
jgi:hypothetical protein